MSDITIRKDLIYVDDKFNYWQVFTRDKLGIQKCVGSMQAPIRLSYGEVIVMAKKYFKKDIRRYRNII